MRIILDSIHDEDFDLALRAVKSCIRDKSEDAIITFGEINTITEVAFWVKKTKSGWSARRLYRHAENHLATK